MDRVRAFIAAKIPSDLHDIFKKCQAILRSGGFRMRWVLPENSHLTLRFLGNINEARITGIHRILGQVASQFAPICISLAGAGVFPNSKAPKVVWLGVGGETGTLEQLVQRMNQSLFEVEGIPFEKRPYRGHLTLGRLKDRVDRKALEWSMDEISKVASGSFRLESLFLIKSELTAHGSVYTTLANVPLTEKRSDCR